MQNELRVPGSCGPTGSLADTADSKIVKYPFGKYEIMLKLTRNNVFLDILEIRINKDFAANIKENQPRGFHDLDEFYPEE